MIRASALTLAAVVALGSPAAAAGQDFDLPEYRGSHYTKAAEEFLTCVALRESSGRWRADGPYGSGAFQMIKSTSRRAALAIGAPEWADKRAYEWPPYVQTEAAYWLVNPYPKRRGLEGKHHWSPAHALTIGKRIQAC